MPGKPEWTDKWVSKITLGTWVRVPGNETAHEDDALRDRPIRPLARWTRRHGLAIFVVLLFVLPALLFWASDGMDRLPRLAIIFGPSIAVAIALQTL